ncbi:MAG: hypothetical protein IT569_01975 [Leptospiraceae bacterium]|nr:hypothetical protein [Leptospiraceae bacterium]
MKSKFFLQFFFKNSRGCAKYSQSSVILSFAKLLFFSFVFSQTAFHCKTVDYAYRHEIAGKIVDFKGREIPGAVVCKIESVEEKCTEREIYTRITDRKGNFQFIYSGLGGKPEPKMIWILLVKHPKFNPLIDKFNIDWIPFQNSPEYGYIKKDVLLEMQNSNDTENKK